MKNEQTTKTSEFEDRLEKLEKLKENAINPYPSKTKRTHEVKDVLDNFKKLEKDSKKITLAGRLRAIRHHGSLVFAQLQDESGSMQIVLSKKEVNKKTVDSYKTFIDLIDTGDFVESNGVCFVTQKGEKSLMVKNWKILTKALRPLPDKFHGLTDEEEVFRKRYLDLLINKGTKELFIKKSKFWEVTRNFMKKRGFLEVETPTLEMTTGGAEARPFKTHHNDFDMDMFLRISVGELWHKKLMAGGFEKTFEIGRIYRNEGSSPEHLQEFTNMEFYWAYADYNDGMKLSRELYIELAKKVFGKTKFTTRGHTFNLTDKWKEVHYVQEIKKQTGVNVIKATEKEMKKKLKELKVKYEGDNKERLTDTLWKYCRKNISGPAFLMNHPKLVSPLAKEDETEPGTVERFQIILAGSEIGNGYSELNDPVDQRKRFELQQELIERGDDEAMMPDWEFVEMLEHGMPPTCGFGMGERLFFLMVDKNAREATLFPLMKPKEQGNAKEEDEDLGIDYKTAKKLIKENTKNENTYKHSIETEAIMRVLAKKFGRDEEKWGIIGLLHDVDWDATENDVNNHTILAKDILQKAGGTDFLVDSIQSHGYGVIEHDDYKGKSRSSSLEHCLVAGETLTGLIVATTLMQPDKKLASVKLSSLKKKFKNKKFAANCNRDIIRECEKADIELDEFLEIGLVALQGISDELGL